MGSVDVRCYGAWKAWKATFIDSVHARIHESYGFQFSSTMIVGDSCRGAACCEYILLD
jgi:hypothetical protein